MNSFSPQWSEESEAADRRGVPKWFALAAALACIILVSLVVVVVIGTRSGARDDASDRGGDGRREDSDSAVQPTVFSDGPQTRPLARSSDGYVGSTACRECHEQEHESWHDSFHRTMTQVATPQAIVGDFDDVELALDGRKYQLTRENDQFWVEFDDITTIGGKKSTRRVRRRIQLSTGSHHMQAYWMATGNGNELAVFPFIWLIPEQRWIVRNMAFLSPPAELDGDPASTDYSEFETSRWNVSCIHCHTTHGQPHAWEWPPKSQVAEFGISCEACHGPGESHVQYHRRGKLGVDPIVHPHELPHERRSEVCGQCHGVMKFRKGGEVELTVHTSGTAYRPGSNLVEMRPGNKTDPSNTRQFWSDGVIRVTGREFNGLRETACFVRGEMSCFSCHQMHQDPQDRRPRNQWTDDQLKPDMRGDKACLQCHESYRQPETLAAHTHHPPDSAGSRCYNCHMPNTTYGLLKATRSHTVDSPSVTETLVAGRPNACNLCHLDKTLKWTDEHLVEWYGYDSTPLPGGEQAVASSINLALKGDAGQRALMAWHFSWGPAVEASGGTWLAPYLAILMNDPYHAVRFIAHKSLNKIGGYADIPYQFDGPPADRKRAVAQITQRWHQRAEPRISPTPELLIKPDRRLDQSAIDDLLKRRDDTPVILDE